MSNIKNVFYHFMYVCIFVEISCTVIFFMLAVQCSLYKNIYKKKQQETWEQSVNVFQSIHIWIPKYSFSNIFLFVWHNHGLLRIISFCKFLKGGRRMQQSWRRQPGRPAFLCQTQSCPEMKQIQMWIAKHTHQVKTHLINNDRLSSNILAHFSAIGQNLAWLR